MDLRNHILLSGAPTAWRLYEMIMLAVKHSSIKSVIMSLGSC